MVKLSWKQGVLDHFGPEQREAAEKYLADAQQAINEEYERMTLNFLIYGTSLVRKEEN